MKINNNNTIITDGGGNTVIQQNTSGNNCLSIGSVSSKTVVITDNNEITITNIPDNMSIKNIGRKILDAVDELEHSDEIIKSFIRTAIIEKPHMLKYVKQTIKDVEIESLD